MRTRRRTAFTLSLLTLLSVGMTLPTSSGINGSAWCLPAAAATAAKASPTGLDVKTLQLLNRGQWNDAVERLHTLTDASSAPEANQAWLGFGLMFLDKTDDLKSLLEKVQQMPGGKDSSVANTIELFALIKDKKFDDATKLGQKLSADATANGVLVNMGLAAAAAKTGKTADAITYCDKAVALAPDFAWGYRTVGYIQDRTLKNSGAAEEYYVKALEVQPDFKEVRDLLADLRVGRNDFDGALDVGQAAIRNNPRDAANYYRLSQILTQQWRLREADVYLDKAIRLNPDNAKYHRARASILRFQHKLVEAIAEQEKAVKLGSDRPFELTELAALNELAGNDSAAADNLREAIKAAPSSQAAYSSAQQKLLQLLSRGKRYDDLITEYERAIQTQPKDAALRLGLADIYLKQNKIEEAEKQLKEASILDQTDPRPHRILGALHLQRKEFPAAARAYTRALNINPGSVEDLVALGYTYAQNDEYMQAETAFVTALALQQLTQAQGSRADVMRSLATLLLTEGRYSEAALNYEEIMRAYKTATTEKQDAFLLAETRALRDRTKTSITGMVEAFSAMLPNEQSTYRVPFIDALLKLGKADTALEQLSHTDGQSESQILTLQARAYRMKGDVAKAAEFVQRALDTKGESAESQADAYTELANVLMAKGDLTGADNAIRKATDLDTKLFSAYEVMGRVYLKRSDNEHALEAAKRALDINPYFAPAYMLNGDAYLSANKPDQALTNYKKAVDLYPASLDAHRSLRDTYKRLAQTDDVKKEDEAIRLLEKES